MTEPYYESADATLHAGDCLDVLRQLPDNSVDSIVTDPPAGIAFMGKEWDGAKGGREQWSAWLAEVMRECLRVAKPGAHALVWALPRTSHWTACGLEDSGWVIRDRIAHAFGSGFPKSLDVSKAVDKAAGATRPVIGQEQNRGKSTAADGKHAYGDYAGTWDITAPSTPAAEQWQGWGTALKPAAEDWWLARKPLDGTVAANVLRWGTGALNVDGTRVAAGQDYADKCASVVGLDSNRNGDAYGEWTGTRKDSTAVAGRWPPNLLLSHSADCEDRCAEDCPIALMDRQSGEGSVKAARVGRKGDCSDNGSLTGYGGPEDVGTWPSDPGGGASRFFPQFRPDPFLYTAKAGSAERPRGGGVAHPTVKPLDLMRWLVRLITPPGGIVLDPFAGSGTTGEAALMEGMCCVLIEREVDYLPLIVQRLTRQRDPVAHAKATGTEGEGLW